MLGTLFFIGEEFFFQPLVFFIALSSRPRSGKREGPDLSVLDFYESFRGCTGDLDIITREVEHVRRRVRRAEDAVRIEEASLKISFEPVGENELEEVSLVDIMFDLLDFLTVRFLIEERAELGFQVACFRLGRFSEADQLFHFFEFLYGFFVIFFEIFGFDINHQYDFLTVIIIGDDLIEQHQVDIFEMFLIFCVQL